MPPPPILDYKRVQQDDPLDATSVSNLEDQTLNSYGSIPNIVEGNDDTIVDDSLYETGTLRNKIARNRSAFAVFSLLGVVAVSFLALGGINRPFLGSFQETTGDITSDIAPTNAVVTPSMTKNAVKDSSSSNGTVPANSDGFFKPLSGSDMIPVKVEPGFSQSLPKSSLLRGFKLNIPDGGSPMRDYIFEGTSELTADTKSYTKSQIITSVDDLQDVTGISGQLSVSYGPMASGSGAGSYLKNSVSTSKTVRIMYYSRRAAYSRVVKPGFKPTKAVQTAINGELTDEILETYGTKYISSLTYGAQLSVVYTVTSETEIDKTEIAAQLKGKIGVGPFKAEFNGKFEKQEGQERAQYNLDIEVKVIGVAVSVPDNPSFDQTNAIIEEFNKKYQIIIDYLRELDDIDEETNVLKQLSPIGFYLEDIAPRIVQLDASKAAAVASRMASVSGIFQGALLKKAQLTAENDDLESIAEGDGSFGYYVYDHWKDQYDHTVLPLLEQRVNDFFAYRSLSADDLFSGAKPAPRGPGKDERRLVRGMLGRGVSPKPEYEGVIYKDMRFVGYKLPETGPIYYGALYCNGGDTKVAGPGPIADVFQNTHVDDCAPSASPSTPPTPEHTPAPTPAPFSCYPDHQFGSGESCCSGRSYAKHGWYGTFYYCGDYGSRGASCGYSSLKCNSGLICKQEKCV